MDAGLALGLAPWLCGGWWVGNILCAALDEYGEVYEVVVEGEYGDEGEVCEGRDVAVGTTESEAGL